MRGYLLDTHVWCWYVTGSDRLADAHRRRIEDAPAECWLSPISCWELGLLVSKGRLRVDRPFVDWLAAARRLFPVQEAALNIEVAAASLAIELPHQDPADRFLAATAQVFELILLTSDRHLLEAAGVETL